MYGRDGLYECCVGECVVCVCYVRGVFCVRKWMGVMGVISEKTVNRLLDLFFWKLKTNQDTLLNTHHKQGTHLDSSKVNGRTVFDDYMPTVYWLVEDYIQTHMKVK